MWNGCRRWRALYAGVEKAQCAGDQQGRGAILLSYRAELKFYELGAGERWACCKCQSNEAHFTDDETAAQEKEGRAQGLDHG